MFDPYHKWLGIPAQDQPPNYYRLLNLQLYEEDLDVVEGAADRAMGFVRQYQSGEHAGLAVSLLNEIAAARLCLLKPASKAEYDSKLKLENSAKETAKEGSRSFIDDAELSDRVKGARPGSTPRYKPVSKRKQKNTKVLPIESLLAGAATIVILLIVVLFFRPKWGQSTQPSEIANIQPEVATNQSEVPTKKPSEVAAKEQEQSDAATEPFADPTDQGYPIIDGVWQEVPGVLVKIIQQGETFTASTVYRREHTEIRWIAEGRISKDGRIEATVQHTMGAPGAKPQKRTAQLSADKKSIEGMAAWDGGSQDFSWTTQESGQYPRVDGIWQEVPGVEFDIVQLDDQFIATVNFNDKSAGEIRAICEGTITEDGKIIAKLFHTKAPPTWKNEQKRTAQLSADGDSIKGTAVWDGGGHDFTWTRMK